MAADECTALNCAWVSTPRDSISQCRASALLKSTSWSQELQSASSGLRSVDLSDFPCLLATCLLATTNAAARMCTCGIPACNNMCPGVMTVALDTRLLRGRELSQASECRQVNRNMSRNPLFQRKQSWGMSGYVNAERASTAVPSDHHV